MAESCLRNFIKIGWVVSEKMFEIKVNARTDGRTSDEHRVMTRALWPSAYGAYYGKKS